MKKKTFWIYALMIVFMIALIIKISFSKSEDKDKGKGKKDKTNSKVDAVVLKPSLLIQEISVSGSLLAYEEVELKNEVAGRIIQLNLPEGKYVSKGTLLVKLFDDDLQAGLRKLKSQLAIQEQIYKRQTELLSVNGISQNDYEGTGLQVNSLKADIEVQKALIRKTEVLAPFNGVVGLRNVSIGAIVTPSTLLATFRSKEDLKLDFFIPEKYGSEIKTGMKVKFTLSGNNKPYDATVIATEQGIDDATRNLKVRAVVNAKSENLISGAFTNVILRLGENKSALLVPTQAIIPQEKNKSVIVSRNGKAHFVRVKTGVRKVSNIEITEGLQAGDTIITSGILFLKEDSKLLFSTIKDSQ